jgi:ABC-type multidrug transport system fused ATPase/permease subunit
VHEPLTEGFVSDSAHPQRRGTTTDVSTTGAIWSSLLKYIKWNRLWKLIAIYMVLLLFLYPLEKIGIPYLVSTFIVNWKPGIGGGKVSGASGGGLSLTLWQACVALLVSFAVVTFLWSILYYVELSMQQRLWMDTKETMVHEVFDLYAKENHEMPLGRWLTHIENVPFLMEQVFYKIVCYVIPELIGVLVVFGYFAYIDKWLGVGALVFVAAFVVYFLMNIKGSQLLAKEEYAQQTDFNQRVHNTIDNMAYIQTAQSQSFELGRFAKNVAAFMETKKQFCWRNSWFLAGMDVLIFSFMAFVVLWTYHQMRHTKPTKMQLGLYVSVFVVLLGEARDLDTIKALLTELYNYTYKSQVFLDEKAVVAGGRAGGVVEKHHGVTESTGSAMASIQRNSSSSKTNTTGTHHTTIALRTEDITYKYENAHRPVVDHMSVEFSTNRLHAIEGPAGCGKSTFAKILAGIHREPDSGRVFLFGRDVTRDPEARRQAVVYLPQHVKLFEGTILENIRYAHTHVTAEEVHRMLVEYGVDRVLQTHANDRYYLQRRVGVNGSGVSGGQKQVIMLMRTCIDVGAAVGSVVPNPQQEHGLHLHQPNQPNQPNKAVIVFDEPTASLDPDMVKVVVSLLQRLAKARTVLVITHDPRVAQGAHTRTRFDRQ